MSCTFTCNGCGKTANADYRYGRWQHPEGWWTRPDTAGEDNAGLTACSRECVERVESRMLRAQEKAPTPKRRAA
ncbi:MAG: hypothetical protein DHS20C14_19250 [Phycisphaeraceae bacterium]|nr:MAG: hypothetical protein DHS20C14_19250 [Phycisphaeraceae bacterium]